MRVNLPAQREADEVAAWRRDRLLRAGFPPSLSARLAADTRYDLHELLDLLARGCPPELAVRILAPLDGEAV